MIDVTELKQAARGRWVGIFHALGIDVRSDGKHSGCPICGPGNNSHRFRMDDKDGSGSFICTQCGAGDGILLIQKVIGLNFQQAIKKIESVIGDCSAQSQQTKPSYDIKKLLNRLWTSSTELTGSDPVSKYLHSRKLVLKPQNIRFCAECYESDSKTKMPAMIAKLVNKNGQPIALHRTYLSGNKKVDIKSPKKLTPGTEPLAGCAIRLFPPKDNTIAIAEGVETALACMHLFEIPTWAATGTSLLEAFEPPEGIRKIIVYGDSDANFAGQKAAFTLANRLYLRDYLVEVNIPPKGDWANIWLKECITDGE